MKKPIIISRQKNSGRGVWYLVLAFAVGFALCFVLFGSKAPPAKTDTANKDGIKAPADGCERQIIQLNDCISTVIEIAKKTQATSVDVSECQSKHGPELQACISGWESSKVRYLSGSQMRIVESRFGPTLVNLNDMYIGRSLKVYGEWSGLETEEIYSQEIKSGNVVLDVGANIGSMAVAFSDLVGPKGLVLAFEAEQLNFITLCANIALQNRFNIHPRFQAVGKRNQSPIGVQKMSPNRVLNFGGHSLVDANSISVDLNSIRDDSRDAFRVPVVAIDTLNLERLDFIKIDVQGMELDVLIGAEDTLKRLKPTVYIENESEPGKPNALRNFFKRIGYTCGRDHNVPLVSPNNFNGVKRDIFNSEIRSVNMLCKWNTAEF